MKGKILVTARSFCKSDGPHQQILRDAGYELVYNPEDRPLKAAELAALIGDVDGAILGLDEVTGEVLAQAKKLRVISRYGVGLDGVDVDVATAHGIAVTITPGANSIAVAELTMALLLALARKIPYFDTLVKRGGWSRVPGLELAGLRLGLVGMGRIGQEVARRARAFDMHILYHDPVPLPPALADNLGASPRLLDELLSECDVISLHLPLAEETHHLIGQQALDRMRPSAFLINTSRGGLVDEQALYDALKSGRLAGAACDVFAAEPPEHSPLLTLDNFIATPHVGSATGQTTLRMGLMASENVLAVLRDEQPQHTVNPIVYRRQG